MNEAITKHVHVCPNVLRIKCILTNIVLKLHMLRANNSDKEASNKRVTT